MAAKTFVSKRLRERLIDEAFGYYLEWRAESEAVQAAYGRWSRTPQTEGALPFAAYGAALDREERAATVYGAAIERLSHSGMSVQCAGSRR